uniref:Uncharacterized protein n=1 Tax=Aegilops tauschii TaxID=37682 RepID=M8BQK7_AEGTA
MDESGDAGRGGRGGGRSRQNGGRSSVRLGVRMEFRFSGFHAVQVPVVSDRLLITITSVDSGKTIAKSSKAAAINGACQWHDSILQAIRFPKDEVSHEFQECQCKIVVSMGSTRTAVLGEAYLNLTNYLSSSDSTDISLPLDKCNSGTVLQLKIQCLGAKSKSSGKSWKELSSNLKESPTNDEMDKKPDVFDILLKLNKGAQSLSENNLEADNADESGNRDASFSASKSHGDDSSKNHLDTAEEKLEELRNAAKMWERHSRKLKIERKTLKNECADKSKQQAELERQLSASLSEQDSLRQEIEQVTAQLNKTQETNIELVSILQELEETIELQRVEMSKLPQVSDVADHEVSKSESTVQEAAEWARILSQKEDEITVLREKLNRVLKMENADGAGPDAIYLELEKENDFLKVKMQELENDCSELTEENFRLIYKLKEASGVAKEEDPCISNSEEMPNVGSPTYKIKHLERKCADLELNLENFRSEFSGLEEKFQKSQEELKERTLELSELREKLSHATELEGADTGSSKHYRLRSEEPDDTETDLDVLKRTVQLKEQGIDGLQHYTREMENTIADIQKEKSQLEERLAASLQESSMTSKCLVEAHEDLMLTSSVDSHVSANEVLETKISELVHTVQLKEQEIDGLQHCMREMENTIADIQKEKSQLEERLAASLQESSMTSKCLVEAHEDLMLTSSVDSHVSANEVLETKISERAVMLKEQEIDGSQHCAREMENTIADIQKEKSQLEERLAASLEESSMTSKCLDEARENLRVLTSSVDSHVSANEVLETKISELVRTVMLKEQEIDSLQHCRGEMENTIADIQKEKSQLEERLAASLEETSMTSKWLDEAREELLVLTSSVESHVSANEVHETKISEFVRTVMLKEQEIDGLQLCTREMENTVADIQKEKSQLEERLAASLEESSMTSKLLDEAREDLLVLSSSVDSHVSANGVLETKINELVRTVMLKEQEINGLQHCTTEMENTISDIQKEKDQLEERLAASLEESSMTSKCLDEAREDLLVLTSSVDSHASANKVLETKISELESRKVELELLVTKLEQENIEFSEFISELEAQLTSLTSEEESTRLEMDYSIALIANLKDLVEQQQAEMEAQKLEMKQKHLESQTRLSEVQEDSEALRRSNAKLQATIDSVAEECSSLQTLTTDLKKQKLELHDHCAQLEQQLDQSKRKTMDLFETAEFLEAKLSTLQKEVTLKEQSLLSELENIFQEHKEHEERINSAHFLLHKIENEKIGEVKNLEREVMSLTAQLSSTDGEKESAALDSIHEVSILRADKAKLEANLEDVSAQMRHYQSQLEDLRTESKTKIKGLIDSLNASKHNEETLTTDVEHMTRLMEAARSNEENLRKTSDELELKYKSSDYEKQEVMEEISGLKIQAKFEKTKLEERLQSLSEECEELKVQNAMLTDKVSCIQSTLHDADEENRHKSTQAKLVVNKGNDDAANDNGGTHVNEDLDIHSKLELLETRLADALEENKSYRAQLQSPTGEGQLSSRDEKDNKDGNRIAQLESELKDMQDRLLNIMCHKIGLNYTYQVMCEREYINQFLCPHNDMVV